MNYLKKENNTINLVKLWVSASLTWLPLPAFILFDLLIMEPYHQVCFRLNGMELVKRSEYIIVWDRTRLKYLKWYQKLGCAYCGYVNGLMHYSKEIANRSEKHWCGIMHKNKSDFKGFKHQKDQEFAEYNNPEDFKEKYGSN